MYHLVIDSRSNLLHILVPEPVGLRSFCSCAELELELEPLEVDDAMPVRFCAGCLYLWESFLVAGPFSVALGGS